MRTVKTPHRRSKFGAYMSMLFLVGFAILLPFKSTHTFAQAVRPTPISRPPQPVVRNPTLNNNLTPPAASKAKAQAARPAAVGNENAKQGNTDSSADRLGTFRVDIPDNVEVGRPFKIDLWIDFKDPNYSGSVDVYMEQTNKVLYEPRSFKVKPNERPSVQVTIVRAASGLALIRANATGLEELLEPVDANFSLKLKPNHLDQALTSGRVTNVGFDFVNSKGEPVALDVPLKLTLQSANLYFRKNPTSGWEDKVELEVRQNESSSPAVEVKPRWLWSPNNGLLEVTVLIANQGDAYSLSVHKENINISVVPRWWLSLVAAILGGVLLSLYQVAQDFGKSNHSRGRKVVPILLTRILPGVLAGGLAYALVNMNILGIKIDTTAWQGFLVLGFLFAYVGVDTILKIVTKKEGDSNPKKQKPGKPGAAPAR